MTVARGWLSNISSALAVALLAAAAGCSVSESGNIKCVDDSSCPSDYGRCQNGLCVAGSPAQGDVSASVLGVPGKSSTDRLRGTVTVQVSARAITGVKAVVLEGSGQTFSPATGALGPVYDITVDTTKLAGGGEGSVELKATVTSGDDKFATALLTVLVDNKKPSFTTVTLTNANARDNTLVTVDVLSDEKLSSMTGAVLSGTTQVGIASEIAAPEPSGSGEIRHLGFAVNTDFPGGPYTIAVSAKDLAGNDADPASKPFTVHKPFSLAALVLTGNATIGGNPAGTGGTNIHATLTLPVAVQLGTVKPVFTLTDANGVLRQFAATPSNNVSGPNSIWTIDDAVTGSTSTGDAAGLAQVTATVIDAAGNVAVRSSPYLVDKVKPTLSSLSADRTFAQVGDATAGKVKITAIASKRLQTATVASDSLDTGTCTCAANNPCDQDPSDNPVVTCTLTVSHTTGANPATATVTLTDKVGNASDALAGHKSQYTRVAAPQINSFKAASLASGAPITLTAGTTTTLTGDFTGTGTVTNTGNTNEVVGITSVIPLTIAAGAAGTTNVYTLHVKNQAGVEVPASVNVSSVAAPVFSGTSFVVSAPIVTASSGTITFTLPSGRAGVTAAFITDDLSNTVVADALSTALTINAPAATRTYTLTGRNGATAPAQVFATVTVIARSAPTGTLAVLPALPNGVTVGGNVTLVPTFTCAGCTATITGPTGGAVSVVTGQSYQFVASNLGSNMFNLSVQNDATVPGSPGTDSKIVTGVAVPAVAFFVGNPAVVTDGSSTTKLTFKITGAACAALSNNCLITGPNVGPSDTFEIGAGLSDGVAHDTSPFTAPSGATSTYTITLKNITGTPSVAVNTTIVSVPAPTAIMTPAAQTIAKGNSVTFVPAVTNAVSHYIADDTGLRVFDSAGSGTLTQSPGKTTRYTLVATNAAGTTASFTSVVTVLNTVTQVASTAARFGATATLMNNGRVLIAGGSSAVSGGALNTAIVYDPAANTFSTAITMSSAAPNGRRNHTAHLLADGRVLLIGGADSGGVPLRSLETFDPVAGTFSAYSVTGGTAGGMTQPRAYHTSTVLANGTILVAAGCGTADCGQTVADGVRQTAEIINTSGTPATAATSGMNAPHVSATATRLLSGSVLIAGGAAVLNGGGTDFAELFTGTAFVCPGSNGVDCTTRSALVTLRTEHTAVLLPNGHVALIGGKGATSPVLANVSIETFDPAGGAATVPGTFTLNGAQLSEGRARPTATSLNNGGRVLVAGGYKTLAPLQGSIKIDVFDVTNLSFATVTADGLTNARGGHTAALLFGGMVLFVGGSLDGGGNPTPGAGELFASDK